MQGRPRKPGSLKQGNSETKNQKEERAELEKKIGSHKDQVMHVPENLDERAKEYYKFLTTELEVTDLLANLDIPILSQTADCLSRMDEADEEIAENGMFINQLDRNNNEIRKENPAVGAKLKYLNHFKGLVGQLGLSPSSRASLVSMNIEKQEEELDPVLQILNRNN